jgi:hypothetical protein
MSYGTSSFSFSSALRGRFVATTTEADVRGEFVTTGAVGIFDLLLMQGLGNSVNFYSSLSCSDI